MYAIIQTGGKQYRVQEGDQITVEKVAGKVGAKVTLDDVLLLRKDKETIVGKPKIANAKVTAEVLEQDKGDKMVVFKKKRRKGHTKKQGHRQLQTTLKITKIQG